MTVDTQLLAPLAQHFGAEPLTVAQYLALGEDPPGLRLELQEGNIVVSSSPKTKHMGVSGGFYLTLANGVPDGLKVIFKLDVDLQLVPPDGPGTVRRPDIIVMTADEYDRSISADEAVRAAGVLLAVEILSPSSRRTDLLLKPAEYAEAGIEHYWVLDIDERPVLTAFRRNADGGYDRREPVSGSFVTDAPFPVHLDLDTLG